MKIKTSVTLSDDLIRTINKCSNYKSLSDFIEAALRNYIAQLVCEKQNKKDLEVINKNASRLNKEAFDVLEFQAGL